MTWRRHSRAVWVLAALIGILWVDQILAQTVSVSGELASSETLDDPQFGASARALGLRRVVQMWQWQEIAGAGGERTYRQLWSEQAIDSQDFADPDSHANPPMPFHSAQWWASTAMLDRHTVAPELLAGLDGWQALPADEGALPENLAVVFHREGDTLISGDGLADPQIGDLRVDWQTLPAGPVHGMVRVAGNELQAGAGTGLERGLADGGEMPGLAQGARPGSDLLLWVAAAVMIAMVLLLLLWRSRR